MRHPAASFCFRGRRVSACFIRALWCAGFGGFRQFNRFNRSPRGEREQIIYRFCWYNWPHRMRYVRASCSREPGANPARTSYMLVTQFVIWPMSLPKLSILDLMKSSSDGTFLLARRCTHMRAGEGVSRERIVALSVSMTRSPSKSPVVLPRGLFIPRFLRFPAGSDYIIVSIETPGARVGIIGRCPHPLVVEPSGHIFQRCPAWLLIGMVCEKELLGLPRLPGLDSVEPVPDVPATFGIKVWHNRFDDVDCGSAA